MNEKDAVYLRKKLKTLMDSPPTQDELLERLLNAIENLPQKMCDELEHREKLCRELRMKQVQDQIDFYHENRNEINKMMYNCVVDLHK